MNNKFSYPKGSEWRKWDLHIHTPESLVHNYGNNSEEIWEKFITDLENLPYEFRIIGINDYLFIDGYEKVLKYKKKGRLQNIELILPVVEFRLKKFAGTNSHFRRVNFHVIFSNEINPDVIQEQFLNNLTAKYTLSPGLSNVSWRGTVTKSSLSDLGRKIKETIPEQRFEEYDSDILEGFNNLNLDENDILECLNKPYFKGKYITAIGKTEWYSMCWNDSSIAEKKDVINKAELVFMSAESVEDFYIAKKRLKEEGVNDLLLDCSDAHYFSDSREKDRIGKCFTWIKADPTFEGLKQIIYEPELRLRIQHENPQENEVYARIEKCIINFPPSLKIKTEEFGKKTNFCLRGKYEIEFSNNLTCIIGGRGIGKSTLVHLLYNASEKMDISKLEKLNSPLLSLDLSPDSLSEMAKSTNTEIPSNTEFFMQNEIEKFARDIDEMSKLIRHRLLLFSSLDGQESLEDLQSEWSIASNSLIKLIEAYKNIANITQKIKSVNKQIETLKKQVAIIQSEEYKKFQKEIEDINSKISQFKLYQNEYNDLITKIDAITTTISQLDWNDKQGKSTLNELSGLLKKSKTKLKESFSKLETEFKTNNSYGKLAEKKTQLKKYLEKKRIKEENIEEIANASEQINELEDEIRALKKQKSPYEKIYSKEEFILNEYKNKYTAYHKRFFTVAGHLESELKDLPFFDKVINFTPRINEQRLRKSAVEFIKENSPAKVTLRTDDIQNVLFDVEDIAEYIKDKKKIKNCVNRSSKTILHKRILQELVNEPLFLENLYLLLWKEFYDINNIQVQTRLEDKLLQNTSFGERCGIVISIILIAGTNPIVIDQPEDNLDGKFISNVLVPLIRKRKLCRQIILVTRDANIVIGGDADLVHILDNDEKEKRTKIVPTSIENIEYRENYIWILDGGKKAFEKREQKYGFK
ncbi:MAG: TrlF family AAA-like ATPase [Candidatus Helarchaeota archaeon]